MTGPDRIWAWAGYNDERRCGLQNWTDSFHDGLPANNTEYIRADLHTAALAAAEARWEKVYADACSAWASQCDEYARGWEQGLREAADLLDKKHRGKLPEHIKSEDGEFVRALIQS